MRQARALAEDPSRYRLPILAAAAFALATWWGVGLPYSLFSWQLDDAQLRWVLICYAWEVPVAGFLGPVLFSQLWWREIERLWHAAFDGDAVAIDADAEEARQRAVVRLEQRLLDYPRRVAWVLMVTSLVGYAVGALQLRLFAALPWSQVVHVLVLGVVTGLVGSLFSFLYLEWALARLLRALAARQPTLPPQGRRIPLATKVFACSVVLTLTALPLIGTVFLNDGARLLEVELGKRLAAEVRHVADDLPRAGGDLDAAAWTHRTSRLALGASGRVFLIDRDGIVHAGSGAGTAFDGADFRPATVARMRTGQDGFFVDRRYTPRVVAVADVGDGRRVLAIVPRAEFDHELRGSLRKAIAVSVAILALALLQGLLFSQQLTRPIRSVTRMAGRIAHAPSEGWDAVTVRTNDEVGELATAFNQMMVRLEDARRALERHGVELERRVAEATRNIETLYDVTRTTTSTLEVDDVLRLVAERTLSALGVERLVLLCRPASADTGVDAYAAVKGQAGGRLAVQGDADLARLCDSPHPSIVPFAARAAALPDAVLDVLRGPEILCVPLIFKRQPYGAIFATHAPGVDLELAGALASQAAVALANAGLFETVRRHERELRELSEMQVRLEEQRLRSLSRELHDGLGQVLLAVKLDLGMVEQMSTSDPGAIHARVQEIRTTVADAIQEVRRISQLMRPSMLDDLGLVPTLRWLVDKFSTRTGIVVDLRTPTLDRRLPAAIEVLLYRVTQEALTNVSKHAEARRITIDLQAENGSATLHIADDGKGFDVDRYRRTPTLWGVGLLGMRERVAYHGGRIDIRSRPACGVSIALHIPITATTDDDELPADGA